MSVDARAPCLLQGHGMRLAGSRPTVLQHFSFCCISTTTVCGPLLADSSPGVSFKVLGFLEFKDAVAWRWQRPEDMGFKFLILWLHRQSQHWWAAKSKMHCYSINGRCKTYRPSNPWTDVLRNTLVPWFCFNCVFMGRNMLIWCDIIMINRM